MMPVSFDFELNRAVLIEIPVEAVVIIADGGKERHDQAARPAHLKCVVAELIVLPEDAVILLVHANAVLHEHWLSEIVGSRHIEVVDVSETVAAELEGIGELAKAVFARIEGTLPEVVGGWIGVGHDHFGDARAVDDGALARAVAIADLMQDEAFSRRKTDAEGPVLPGDLPAIDRETRPLLLYEIERLDPLARIRSGFSIVVALGLGDRDDLCFIDQVNHPILDQVDQGNHAFDRVGVAVVLGVGPPVRDGADQTSPFLDLAVEIASRERVDLDELDVGFRKAAPLHGPPPAHVGFDDVANLEEFLDDHRWLTVGESLGRMLPPGRHRAGAEIDNREVRGAGRIVEDGSGRAPL